MADGIEFVISATDTSGSAFASSSKGLGAVGSAATSAAKVVAAAGAAVYAFTAGVAQSIVKTTDFANQMGVSVEQFSALQAAAVAANIDAEAFNSSLKFLAASTAAAARGAKEDTEAFNALGISVKEFKKLDLNGQMQLLAKQLEGVTDSSERVRISMQLFGRGSVEMLKMLGGGAEAMEKARQQAEYLGLAIGPQMAANAQEFNNAFDMATGALKGMSLAVGNELMPLMAGLTEQFAIFVAESRAGVAAFVKGAILGMFTTWEVIKQVFTGIGRLFTDRTAQETFLKNMAMLPVQLGLIAVAAGHTLLTGLWEAFKLIPKALASVAGSIGQILANAITGKQLFDGVNEFTDYFFKEFDDATGRVVDNAKEMGQNIKWIWSDVSTGMAESFGVNLKTAQAAAQANIDALSNYGTAAAETVTAAATDVKSKTDEVFTAGQEAGMAFYQSLVMWNDNFVVSFFSAMQNGIDNLSSSMATAIVDGASVMDAFKKSMKSMVAEVLAGLIKMGIQWMLNRVLIGNTVAAQASQEGSKAVGLAWANGIASWAAAPWPINMGAPAFGAAMGAAAASGLAAGGALGGTTGAAIAGARADGGPVAYGKTYLVGERGPELFTAGSSGMITPNEMLGGGGGGSVVIENLEIVMFPNATNADAIFDMDSRRIAELLKQPVLDALNSLDGRGIQPRFARRAV